MFKTKTPPKTQKFAQIGGGPALPERGISQKKILRGYFGYTPLHISAIERWNFCAINLRTKSFFLHNSYEKYAKYTRYSF